MKISAEKILAKDKFGTKVMLRRNQEEGYDLQTDGRIFLTPSLARHLSAQLLKFADKHDRGFFINPPKKAARQ